MISHYSFGSGIPVRMSLRINRLKGVTIERNIHMHGIGFIKRVCRKTEHGRWPLCAMVNPQRGGFTKMTREEVGEHFCHLVCMGFHPLLVRTGFPAN